jgi:hypothetical protein
MLVVRGLLAGACWDSRLPLTEYGQRDSLEFSPTTMRGGMFLIPKTALDVD